MKQWRDQTCCVFARENGWRRGKLAGRRWWNFSWQHGGKAQKTFYCPPICPKKTLPSWSQIKKRKKTEHRRRKPCAVEESQLRAFLISEKPCDLPYCKWILHYLKWKGRSRDVWAHLDFFKISYHKMTTFLVLIYSKTLQGGQNELEVNINNKLS